MWLTRGCLLPHEDHGKADYLTIEDLEKSAKLDNLDLDAAVQTLIKTVEVPSRRLTTIIARWAFQYPRLTTSALRDESAQVDAVVRQLGGIGGRSLSDELCRSTYVPAAIHADGRGHNSVFDVEGDEVAVPEASSDHQLVPVSVETGVLEVVIVLIGPEPMDLVVNRGSPHHVARRGRTLVERVVPVLYPHHLSEDGMVMIRDVSGGEDAVDIRAAVFVDHDPVVDFDPGTCDDLGDWLDANADHREIAIDPPVSLGDEPLHVTRAFESRDAVFEDHLHAMIAMDVLHGATDLVPEHPRQRELATSDRHDLNAHLAERRSDLRADEPHPNDCGPAARGDLFLDAVAVCDSAEVVDALKIQPRDREPAVAAPRRDQDLVVGDALAVR
jgi:hypothetical protein